MLKTQITGAKYLSPQTNQMTNLNIAVPADSKDTEFGTSDILLAKDVVAYLNALDSDISNELADQTDKINKINQSIKQLIDHNLIKIVTELPTTDIDKNCIYLVPNKDGEGNNIFIEYIYVESKNTFEEVGRIQAKVDLSDYYTKEETDNQIQIAKNSAINIHNEDDTKSIKLDVNDTEAVDKYGSAVNASLIDDEWNNIANINAGAGFEHINNDGHYTNLSYGGLRFVNLPYMASMSSHTIGMANMDNSDFIEITDNKELTQDEQDSGYSPLDISLTDDDYKATINAKMGFTHNTNDGFTSSLNGYGLSVGNENHDVQINSNQITLFANDDDLISLDVYDERNRITIGKDKKFGISRPADNTEGATITGVKSLTAFANPSATKVWATDGSTVDLTTKADASDVLLKKSASGGYYIEQNSNVLGSKAFAANNTCAAVGTSAHAAGKNTNASGQFSHAEGENTLATGYCAHTEGYYTKATGPFSQAQGCYNVDNKLAIHSIGIGKNSENTKNSEWVLFSQDNPKNGYKYLIGVGGYDGISTDNTTYKSVQEVIADLTSRIEQLETKVRALEAANTPA